MLEIAIIGAGPAGLSAGINAIARGKTVRIFSSEGNYLLRAEKVNNYLGLYDVSFRSSKAGEREGKGGGRLSEWAGAAGGWTIYSPK